MRKMNHHGALNVLSAENVVYGLVCADTNFTSGCGLRYALPAPAKKAGVGRGNPQYLGCKAATRAVFVLVHVLSVMGRACGQLRLVAIRDCDFPPRAYLLAQCVETLVAGKLNFSETSHV